MKAIDETRLESDLDYRYQYLAEFVGFGDDDVAAIHEAGMLLGPLVESIVDRTYAKLLAYDATARHFLQRQHGCEAPVPASLSALSQNHSQIRFRKEHLQRYFMNLLGRSYDEKMTSYLDMAGKIHTSKAGNKDIIIPLVQMNALLGLLSDTLIDAISTLDLEPATMLQTIRAFNKILWIQNDLVSRHYVTSGE